VVSRSLDVLEGHVCPDLVLINLEVEVRLGLDLSKYIPGNARLLFTLYLLFESECLELLLDELVDSLLDLIQVLMIILIDRGNLGEDALLLLGAAQL